MEIIKKLFAVKNIRITVVDAEGEIKRLLHLWSEPEQASAGLLMKQVFIDVQAMAKKAWHTPILPSLEKMHRYIDRWGPDPYAPYHPSLDEHDPYFPCDGSGAAATRWIFLVHAIEIERQNVGERMHKLHPPYVDGLPQASYYQGPSSRELFDIGHPLYESEESEESETYGDTPFYGYARDRARVRLIARARARNPL
jgi:hypothetical protein